MMSRNSSFDILKFIKDYHKENELMPTNREIAERFNIHKMTVKHHLDTLVELGFIKIIKKNKYMMSRGIEIVDRNKGESKWLKVWMVTW